MKSRLKRFLSPLGIAYIIVVCITLFAAIFIYVMSGGNIKSSISMTIICCTIAVVINVATNMTFKRVIKNVNTDIEKASQGDFVHMIATENTGIIKTISVAVNSIITEMRALVEKFFLCPRLLWNLQVK